MFWCLLIGLGLIMAVGMLTMNTPLVCLVMLIAILGLGLIALKG